MARDKFAADDSMLLIYGDTLFEGDIETMMKSASPVIGVFEVPDPKRFGVIEKGEGQTITNLVEKPEKFVSNLAIPGVNYFPSSAELFAALEHIVSNNIRTKNEYQATDAFQYMLKEKKTIFTWQILTAWDDAGTLEAILDTNKIILSRQAQAICRRSRQTRRWWRIRNSTNMPASAKVRISKILHSSTASSIAVQ